MTLINQDQIEGEFSSLELGTAPFASTGALRLGSVDRIVFRNAANDDDLTAISMGGSPGSDEIHFGEVIRVVNATPGVGKAISLVANNDFGVAAGGGVSVGGGDGETQGGDILLYAGNATESGAEGGGGITVLGGNGVDAGGVIGVFAGNASADSTAGAGIEIGSGIGKGAPVSSIQFLTAGSEAVAGAAQTSNLRGTMADEVFTWDGVLKLTPRAFADLPAAPTEGMMAWVNDSNTATWGATVAGGGANKVLAVFNGTDWTCAAK